MTKVDKIARLEAERAALKHKLIEIEAQLAHVFCFADSQIAKLDRNRLMASGVLMQLHLLGGKEAMIPVVFKDGFSDETISSLRADLRYSYDLSVIHKPKEA